MWDLIVSVPDHCLSFYFMSALAYVCVVSAYAFMFAVGVYVCECVRASCRACVNFVSNAEQIYSKLVASKIMHYHNALFI